MISVNIMKVDRQCALESVIIPLRSANKIRRKKMSKRHNTVVAGWILLTISALCSVRNQTSQLKMILATMKTNQHDHVMEALPGDNESLLEGKENTIRENNIDERVDTPHENVLSPESNPREAHEKEHQCLSPEGASPWILDGTCTEQQYLSSFSSGETTRSCGLCGEQTSFLRSLRDVIANKFEEQCKDLVVYGAALGKEYEDLLQNRNKIDDQASKVVERYGTCFFQFVTDTTNAGHTHSIDGSQILITVKQEWLPYQSNRRNTKLFKFIPGLLFPWADRVIWQDSKLLQPQYKNLPSNYLLHFNRTVQHYGTCSSYMGLPYHAHAIGRNVPNVKLQFHCDVVMKTARERPSISDDLEVLRTQCDQYIEKHNNSNLTSSQVFNQNPLVDSAFIVYDMRSSACRKFIGDFGCSWLDEVHCYSDRDQISFPHVLASTGLRLSPKLELVGQEYRDRIYVNEDDIPIVHIAKRSCHWHYGSFSRCVALRGEQTDVKGIKKADEPYSSPAKKGQRRVAVIIAGTTQRFIFHQSLRNFVGKMWREGTSIDCYISLTTTAGKAFRSGLGYTQHFQIDPSYQEWSKLRDMVDLEEFIRGKIEFFRGLSIAALTIDEMIDIDSEPLLKARRDKAQEMYPNEDPDQRFPVFDIRRVKEAQEHNANANRNLLRMHLAIQNLWTIATKFEAEEDFNYDYVVFMRDDSLWLDQFRMSIFDRKGSDNSIFVPSCDARDPPMDPNELNDHLLISRRNVADIFGNYYSTLFETDINACMENLPVSLNRRGRRGCNSEMLLKWVAMQHNLDVVLVSQSEVPFQRSANIRLPDGSNKQCFHKFCQSQSKPLRLNENDNIEKCEHIDWSSIFKDHNGTEVK